MCMGIAVYMYYIKDSGLTQGDHDEMPYVIFSCQTIFYGALKEVTVVL